MARSFRRKTRLVFDRARRIAQGRRAQRRRADGSPSSGSADDDQKLGTFLGVFTPSILTILGVILFLRTGWVVGNVGLAGALSIVVIAHLITLATAMSVSSVATNMHVGAGGAYFIISRGLGIEIGAAIGIPLFLAQTFSVTLYAYGLVESIQLVWPGVPPRLTAALVVLVVSLISLRSAKLALKLQLPIMAAIGLSMLVLFVGVIRRVATNGVELVAASGEVGFWVVFAVFFPAVTGLMAGVSLSGDLREPKRSLPRGTITAVLAGFAVYLIIPVALAVTATSEELLRDNLIWFGIAGGLGFLIFPGLWGAIFSSAVGSILGAPRTLQAMVADRVLPRFLAPGGLGKPGNAAGESTSLGGALALSTMVALAAVTLGGLDAVAPILTMFFLTTYGMVNLVAGLEQLSGDPSYRPTLRTPWFVSLAAAAGCIWVMFLINRWACLLAVAFEIGVYVMMRRRQMSASWGDLRRGALVALVRATVLSLKNLPEDPRNWRPHILLFAGDVARRQDLVRFAAWLGQDRGILSISRLVVGSIADKAHELHDEQVKLDAEIDDLGLRAFGEVDIVPDFESGAIAIAQGNGIAGIHSNMVMFGWSDKKERMESNLRIVQQLSLIGKSALICRTGNLSRYWSFSRIDVWWGGLQHNGDLLLLFAHLISLNSEWRRATIRVKSIATNEMMQGNTTRALESMIHAARIEAETKVIIKPPGANILSLIHESSRDANVVLMGLRDTKPGEEAAYAERLAEIAEDLPSVIFVRNAGEFAGELLGTANRAEERLPAGPDTETVARDSQP